MEQLAARGGLLMVRGLKKAYGGSVALRSVDLDVESGSIHALLGENGAGKSLLSGLSLGAKRPTEARSSLTEKEWHFGIRGRHCGGGCPSSIRSYRYFAT